MILPPSNSIPNAIILTLPLPTSTIEDLIDLDARTYGVSSDTMRIIVKRESAFAQYAKNINPPREMSYGLVQINLPAHPDTSIAEAFSPVYALNFLAQNLSVGNCYLWSTCPLTSKDRSL